jgi:hypothetical protein
MTTRLTRMFLVLGIAGHLAGCATSPTLTARGAVLSTVPGARSIVAGPADVHAYSGFSGGEIYLVRSSTSSNSDCAGAPNHGTSVPIPADKVTSVSVPAGATACLHTRVDDGYELLWHARAGRGPSALVAKATGRKAQ